MTPRPLSIAFALTVFAGAGDVSAADSALMDAWKAYAQSSMTPAFGWAEPQRAAAPTLLNRSPASAAAAGPIGLELVRGLRLDMALPETSDVAQAPRASYSQLHAREAGFVQISQASTLSTVLPSQVSVGLSAVVSQQRFLTPGMGESAWRADQRIIGVAFGPGGEVVSGFGMRADMQVPAGESSRWLLSLQSRIDMESFKSYRGVYSEPGDFDTPAQAGLRFAQDIGRATLSLGAERIFYSDVSAITSYALPNRLLSLLGDGNSPSFAWRDHTVYSLGLDYAVSRNGAFSLQYSTRLQPSPTSAQLRRAMESDFSNRNFALAYKHGMGRMGWLQLSASHSGASYFIGSAPLRQSDFDRSSINEIELLWALPF